MTTPVPAPADMKAEAEQHIKGIRDVVTKYRTAVAAVFATSDARHRDEVKKKLET